MIPERIKRCGKMNVEIHMISVDHKKAGIDIRELFTFCKSEAAQAMKELKREEGVCGCLILSTCNRTEIWISSEADYGADLMELLCRLKGVSRETYGGYLLCRHGREAIEHLFYLTAGLKSQIIGEDQILTQVKEALTMAREHYCTDQALEVLFRMAVTAGKKCKARVRMPRGNTSAAGAVLEQLEQEGYGFAGKKCLVIGNGMMGKLAATLLMEKGAEVTVTVRQYRSGIVDTPRGVKRIDYEGRYDRIAESDYVFSATASPNLTIKKERLETFPIESEKVFVDLAVPRDVDPEIRSMPNIVCYDMDSLEHKELSMELQNALKEADSILEEGILEFEKWYEARDVVPQLLTISEKAAEDVMLRLEKPMKKVPPEEEADLERAIETAAKKVVSKLLFGIRDSMNAETLRDCLVAMESLYEPVE